MLKKGSETAWLLYDSCGLRSQHAANVQRELRTQRATPTSTLKSFT